MELPREYDLSSLGNTTFRDGLTIQEVINILENNAEGSLSENEDDESSPNTVDIYITPGEPSVLTDQDSADEDTGGTLDNLCGRQLLADAEIRLNTRDVTDKCLSITDYRQKKRKWIDGDLTFINTNSFEANTFEKYKNLTCAEMFEIFFDDDCIKLIKDETTKYAAFLNKPDPNISINEIRSFIGILLLSGYNTLPGKKFYWDTKPDMHNTLVSGSMRRDRFIQIMKFMHLADNNNLDKNDKFFKLRPLINHMKKKCIENFIPHENISYDEAMIKYYGKHSCKQYIKGKPIRFGYKAWCLNTDYGYLINFDFYQGKNPTGNTAYENLVGKAAAPLLTMLDELASNKQKLPYVIFFDNLFTGFNLLNILKQRGYFGTGTIREKRIPKDCPLPTNKEFKNASRGSIISSLEKKSGVFVTKWKDNAVVAAASTAFGKEPEKCTKRYSQKEKKIIHIKQPNIIRQYNKYMGGTDRI